VSTLRKSTRIYASALHGGARSGGKLLGCRRRRIHVCCSLDRDAQEAKSDAAWPTSCTLPFRFETSGPAGVMLYQPDGVRVMSGMPDSMPPSDSFRDCVGEVPLGCGSRHCGSTAALPETRLASSLSPVEIFVALYYGGKEYFALIHASRFSPQRDRCIHQQRGMGRICMYPILADLGYFPVCRVCRRWCVKFGRHSGRNSGPGDPGIRGPVNGSLGHGLGVGTGNRVGTEKAHGGATRKSVFCG